MVSNVTVENSFELNSWRNVDSQKLVLIVPRLNALRFSCLSGAHPPRQSNNQRKTDVDVNDDDAEDDDIIGRHKKISKLG